MDKQVVVSVLKKEGIEIGEEMAVNAVRAAFRLIIALAPQVSTGLGRTVPAIISYIEPLILEQLDKIDGKDSPDY